MRPKRKQNHSVKLKSEQGEKDVQTLKAKNVEEIAKRIEEAEAAAESSEDSPFVSESEYSDDEVLPVFWLIAFLSCLYSVFVFAFNFKFSLALGDRTVSSHVEYRLFNGRKKLCGISSLKKGIVARSVGSDFVVVLILHMKWAD